MGKGLIFSKMVIASLVIILKGNSMVKVYTNGKMAVSTQVNSKKA